MDLHSNKFDPFLAVRQQFHLMLLVMKKLAILITRSKLSTMLPKRN
jgi:hypothetical protein